MLVLSINIEISLINHFYRSTNKVALLKNWIYFQENFPLKFCEEFCNQEFMRHHNMILCTVVQ